MEGERERGARLCLAGSPCRQEAEVRIGQEKESRRRACERVGWKSRVRGRHKTRTGTGTGENKSRATSAVGHGGAMSHQVCSRQSIYLIWDGAKSRVPEVQTEVPVLSSPRDAAVPVDDGWLIRGILLSGDSGPEGRAEKQQRAGPGVVGGLELRERGAGAGLRCKGAGSWELGAGSRPGAWQRSCSKICSNTFLALHT